MPRRGRRDPGPAVVAVALAAWPARAGFPRRCGRQPGQGRRSRLPPRWQGDPEVHRDREHIPLAVLLAGGPQLRGAAVDLIAGHPGERHCGADRAGHHGGAQLGLGGELHAAGDLRPLPPFLVAAPGFRQVEPEIEQGVGAGGDIGAEHDGLAVLDLAGDPRMLAGHPDRHLASLQLGGLIQHQHRIPVAQVIKDEPLQRGQRRPPVPGVLTQQRLHPPWRGMLGSLGQLPARPAVPGLSQQRADISKRRKT